MNMDSLKKISMTLTVLITLGGAIGGFYNFAYEAGYKVGSAETKSNSITGLLKSAEECTKRTQDLRDRLFECRIKCP